MSMKLKDFNMNGQELTTVTKNLILSILRNLDWEEVKKTFFELSGEFTEEQRQAVWQMFVETENGFQNFEMEIDKWAEAMDLSNAFEYALKSETEEQKPEMIC